MVGRRVLWAFLAALVVGGCATSGGVAGSRAESGFTYPTPLLDRVPEEGREKERKARLDLALAYLELGRVDVALDEIQKARALDRNDPLVPYAWGLAHLALGDRATAEASFRAAEQLAPGDPDILHALGTLLCEAGHHAEGLVRLQRAAANPYYPRRGRSLANTAWCAWRAGDESQAQQMIDLALALQPDDFLVQMRALQWAVRKKQWEVAARHLDRLLRSAPDDPTVWWLAANVAHAKGDRVEEARWTARLRHDAPERLETRRLERGEWEAW